MEYVLECHYQKYYFYCEAKDVYMSLKRTLSPASSIRAGYTVCRGQICIWAPSLSVKKTMYIETCDIYKKEKGHDLLKICEICID
jgi:hypothetical protein